MRTLNSKRMHTLGLLRLTIATIPSKYIGAYISEAKTYFYLFIFFK